MDGYSVEIASQIRRFFDSLSEADRRRYAGIEAYDSGSGTLSSLLWDSLNNYFFVINFDNLAVINAYMTIVDAFIHWARDIKLLDNQRLGVDSVICHFAYTAFMVSDNALTN